MSNAEEIKIAEQILKDLAYDSFNAKAVRTELAKHLTIKERITLVAAYCQLGNNANKSVGKVKVKHNEIKDLVAKSKTTLARIGLSHAALVYNLRGAGINKGLIQIRFSESKTPPIYQDPAIAAYSNEGRDFYNMFSKLISKTPPKCDYFELATKGITDEDKELIKYDLDGLIKLMKENK